jgi:hypothetical protein
MIAAAIVIGIIVASAVFVGYGLDENRERKKDDR